MNDLENQLSSLDITNLIDKDLFNKESIRKIEVICEKSWINKGKYEFYAQVIFDSNGDTLYKRFKSDNLSDAMIKAHEFISKLK